MANRGTLDDLLDLKRTANALAAAFVLAGVAGCSSPVVEVDFQASRSWEGHYFEVGDFYEATRSVSLERGESIWVLSNRTLERVLTQTQKNEK